MPKRSETSAKLRHVAALEGYAGAVSSGQIPACEFVRLACSRHLDDLRKSQAPDYPYRFDPRVAERVCRIIELLPHVKGQWARRGEILRLQPWQSFILGALFGWLRKADGKRRFREAYLEIPRKNGKSILAAAIGLYCFGFDREFGAEVYSGATTEQQAWEVFRPAKLMMERCADIAQEIGCEVWAKALVRDDGSVFKPVIGKPGDGASPSCAIVDEYHEHDTPDLVDTMITGMGAREQPLLVIITTAGGDISGPCYEKHVETSRVLQGVIENDNLFGLMYGIDQDDDWTRPEVLRKANPNLGVSVDEDFLCSQQRQATLNTAQQSRFKTKHLNVWLQARAGMFNTLQWQGLADPLLNREEMAGAECFFGVDLASKIDLCAVVHVWRKLINGDPHYYVMSRFYLPESAAHEPGPNQAAYRRWAIEGLLTVTDGATIDYELILEDILEDARKLNPTEIVYDPFNATHFAQLMTDAGLMAVEYPQTANNLAVPADELVALMRDARIHHDGSAMLSWCIANTVARRAKKGLMLPTKEKEHQKIDGAIALIMALGRMIAKREDVIPGIELLS